MSHVTRTRLHAYASRGLDLRISVVTSEDTGDFSSIAFHVGSVISKTGLTADDTATGFDVDVTLNASDTDQTAGFYVWELRGTFGGQVRTLATGPFNLEAEPT